ncbi:MAG: hypothetical protein DRR16_33665 [Candidatus Parabeggiatoa sp. nov. 3]|nr:MAG: hypothetical protein DRQ99_21515 [Gammaproteobacteria bacterium]RKZ72829.1 MAG: hypothetical protein DRR16_33665 [Gammaproteobacteria bacterium]
MPSTIAKKFFQVVWGVMLLITERVGKMEGTKMPTLQKIQRRGNPLWLPHFKIHENLCFSTYQKI